MIVTMNYGNVSQKIIDKKPSDSIDLNLLRLQMKEGEQKQKQGQKQKQQQSKTLQKCLAKLYFAFCGDDQIDPVINRSIVSNTYQQIIEILHFSLLYAVFGKTLNSTYDIIQTVLSALIIVVCFIPRVMNKHHFLLFTMLIFIVITLASAAAMAMIIINYFTFVNYCTILKNYAEQHKAFRFKAQSLCSSIISLYHMQMAFGSMIELLRIIYICVVMKAYKASKAKFNLEEKKRRRQQKFDENMKNKNTFDPNRKI